MCVRVCVLIQMRMRMDVVDGCGCAMCDVDVDVDFNWNVDVDVDVCLLFAQPSHLSHLEQLSQFIQGDAKVHTGFWIAYSVRTALLSVFPCLPLSPFLPISLSPPVSPCSNLPSHADYCVQAIRAQLIATLSDLLDEVPAQFDLSDVVVDCLCVTRPCVLLMCFFSICLAASRTHRQHAR